MTSVEVIEITDAIYPKKLKALKSPPKRLYCKGSLETIINVVKRKIAVVGSRRCTVYADLVINRLLPELIAHNITIISGFMFGVDSKAHKICIENSGVTVGVLPYGINFTPPSHMRTLYHSILDSGGALISEYPEDHPPEKWTFISRNRIVAALSDGIIVVEAAESSGSLHTAKFANHIGTKVFSVPGSILSPSSVGTNKLIAEGAILVTTSNDILPCLGLSSTQLGIDRSIGNRLSLSLSSPENTLYKLIYKYPGSTFDVVFSNSNLATNSFNVTLASLLLKGVIMEHSGRYYVAKN